MNEAWTKATDGTQYNLEAFRRDGRKRGNLMIHMHSPEDACSDFEHETFDEDGELTSTTVSFAEADNG